MDTFLLIIFSSVFFSAICVVFLLMRQLYNVRVGEVAVKERLAAKQIDISHLQSSLSKAEEQNDSLKLDIQSYKEQLATIRTSLDLERKQFEDKLALLNDSREQMSVAFKNIANEIIEDKTRKFTANSKETLATVLNPLQEKIRQFEKRVEETYDKESKERFSLAKEIKNLQELNSRISEDAINLTNALKGDNKNSKTREN